MGKNMYVQDVSYLLAYTDQLEDELLEATTAAKEVTRLAAENERLKAALKKYADPKNWTPKEDNNWPWTDCFMLGEDGWDLAKGELEALRGEA